MTLSINQWHQRYLQQARWTYNIRQYIYNKVGVQQAGRILDVGCGTGVLEYELARLSPSQVFGLDIDFITLQHAREYAPISTYTAGDCLHLPYRTAEFDVTLCHFLLLWVNGPRYAIEEMIRITRPRGFVLALAEPDYGGRIDYPLELEQIGSWQIDALKQQGANPYMGRELRSIFTSAGLLNIEVGVVGGQWGGINPDKDITSEWDVISSDLNQNDKFILQAEKLKTLEIISRDTHQRILFVPTFYAFGMVP
jgi:SAM-dependent methyltransferase